ncbi:MAG TPA: hypothetical protein VM431_14395 [Phycisphaerae bacterium]|nr:hypothetical protein [Phycisphaerae bacterium]
MYGPTARSGRRRLVLAALAAVLVPAAARAGGIRAVVEATDPIKRVWAVQRSVQRLKDSQGKVHDIGLYGRLHEGKVDGNRIAIEGLPVPGRYDLQLETASGGTVAGWDATVPESDYEGDPPLDEASRKAIFAKLGNKQFSAFADDMWVLDVRGNIQHAALLVMTLRMRPFVGGGYKEGEWVWRIDRWHWENPDEHTWVPYQERPYYALIRERLYEKQYRDKRVCYARHLGGIALTKDRPEANLNTVKIPTPVAGIVAVNPDGSRIGPVVLKGSRNASGPDQPKAAESKGGQSEGGR